MNLLPGIEPSENDLIERVMNMPLEVKIKKAILLLKEYDKLASEMSDDGYWLAYSGGKDSGVILELANMAGIKYEAVYSVTTIDPPELIWFIKREHPEVRFLHPEIPLLSRLVERTSGPPTRIARWCCEEYKEGAGDDACRIIGVRAAESPRRKATWKQITRNNKNDGIFICPIIYWTDDDVWEFHRIRNIPYCKLYDEGFKRLGCIGCPLAGPKQQRHEFDRWPRYEAMWKRAFKRFWDKWHGVPTRTGGRRYFEDFGSWEGLWDWWIKGVNKDNDNGCQMEFMWQ